MISRNARVNILIGNGHFLSHFYILTLPPLFLFIQKDFDVSYAELGLVPVVMSAMGAIMQTPYGFLVDRFGARRFLVINTLVMGISVSLMGAATAYWQILVLAGVSGLANAVYHPADYTILSASIRPEKMGQAFAIHTFTGNAGFALAPPIVAVLASLFGWREALMIVGLVSVPVAAAIVWQISVFSDVASQKKKTTQSMTLSALIFDRTMILFFFFYLLGSAAGSGVQAWLITILHQVKGMQLALASSALTAYMVGTVCGILFGGWVVDRSKRYVMIMVAGLTGVSSLLTFFVGIAPMTGVLAIVPDVPLGPRPRRQPHAARHHAERRGAALRDRQGLRLRLLGPGARQRADAGTVRLSHRSRLRQLGADHRVHHPGREHLLHGHGARLGQEPSGPRCRSRGSRRRGGVARRFHFVIASEAKHSRARARSWMASLRSAMT